MSILKKVLVVLVLGIGGFLAFAMTRPDTYRVERSQRIEAPAEVVFAQVDTSSRGRRGRHGKSAIRP